MNTADNLQFSVYIFVICSVYQGTRQDMGSRKKVTINQE